tara:strand:- start:3168 stop:3365 length:198 start_codon:yes stop_codon:yes gene_type:complete
MTSIDSFIDSVNNKDFNEAEKVFSELLGDKVALALDAEKISIADDVYNSTAGDEELADTLAADDE